MGGLEDEMRKTHGNTFDLALLKQQILEDRDRDTNDISVDAAETPTTRIEAQLREEKHAKEIQQLSDEIFVMRAKENEYKYELNQWKDKGKQSQEDYKVTQSIDQ